MLFIDNSSAFNTIVSSKLITKIRTLGLNTSLYNWILDFPMGSPQVIRVGNNTSATLISTRGPLRGACSVPSCTPCSPMTAWPGTTPTPSLSLPMTLVGLITYNDETAYREEIRDLAVWCQNNNLSLNVIKTKEMNVDYRKRRIKHGPILIAGLWWSRLRASSSLVSTSPTNYHGSNTPKLS
jgi:hypothetical protein